MSRTRPGEERLRRGPVTYVLPEGQGSMNYYARRLADGLGEAADVLRVGPDDHGPALFGRSPVPAPRRSAARPLSPPSPSPPPPRTPPPRACGGPPRGGRRPRRDRLVLRLDR